MKFNQDIFPYYQFDNLSQIAGLWHFVTSGNGGSTTDMNLRNVASPQNRAILAQAIGFDIAKLVTPEQTHSTNVHCVQTVDAGCGATDIDSRIPNTDALITNEVGVAIMILTADCVPILLFDRVGRVAAAIHAGWRGTGHKIVEKTIDVMKTQYGTKPADLLACIGPCISSCCFEVGLEVAAEFDADRGEVVIDSPLTKPHVDLKRANYNQLIDADVLPRNIEVSEYCTYCNNDLFYSYRRNSGMLYRMGTGIVITA